MGGVDFLLDKFCVKDKPVGYCESDEDCADGYSCVNNKCTKNPKSNGIYLKF